MSAAHSPTFADYCRAEIAKIEAEKKRISEMSAEAIIEYYVQVLWDYYVTHELKELIKGGDRPAISFSLGEAIRTALKRAGVFVYVTSDYLSDRIIAQKLAAKAIAEGLCAGMYEQPCPIVNGLGLHYRQVRVDISLTDRIARGNIGSSAASKDTMSD